VVAGCRGTERTGNRRRPGFVFGSDQKQIASCEECIATDCVRKSRRRSSPAHSRMPRCGRNDVPQMGRGLGCLGLCSDGETRRRVPFLQGSLRWATASPHVVPKNRHRKSPRTNPSKNPRPALSAWIDLFRSPLSSFCEAERGQDQTPGISPVRGGRGPRTGLFASGRNTTAR
jgi:hypothetical protein